METYNPDTPPDLLIEIVKQKHAQLPQILKEVDIDCWLVFIRETSVNPDPVQDLIIGGDVVWESAFIFYLDKDGDFRKIAIIGNFDADAEKEKNLWDEVISYKKGISQILRDKIAEIDPSKIALNYSEDDVSADGLSHGLYLKIADILHDYTDIFCSAQTIIQKVRSRKSEIEKDLIKESTILAEDINREMTKLIEPGMTEIEIQKKYHQKMDELNVIESWERTGCPAIDAGPDKVMGHVGPTTLKTQKGHTLHNDFGVKLHGYCSDIQRMWFFGSEDELPEELDHAFKTVHGAISEAADFIRPRVKGWEVDQVARDYVKSQGYDEYDHALGHQVGRAAHDGGMILGPKWERYGDLPDGKVEKDQVFTLELYVKTDNYGMVSLEEEILITDDGCEFIIPRQNDWRFIE